MEDPNKINYTSQAMLALSAAMARDEEAFHWLMENDFKELAALVDALLYRKFSALTWLRENNFQHIASFIGALKNDQEAIDYLMLNHGKQWAATADLVNGNEKAREWLQQFFPQFIPFADSLLNNNWPVGMRNGYGGIGWI